jgi:hypothetical protein
MHFLYLLCVLHAPPNWCTQDIIKCCNTVGTHKWTGSSGGCCEHGDPWKGGEFLDQLSDCQRAARSGTLPATVTCLNNEEIKYSCEWLPSFIAQRLYSNYRKR